ncbi:MATH domain and coiled-coil domain-containing protein [Cardamine amara subsp. amara]|uniref:MATH domain and coiled-coil domain-containing protein n=1 Tax=Cardamine amara subsp. amara TaxID=228776 RepID=A0ABD1C968_CARAN
MRNQVDNKFTWVIKNLSSLRSKTICSDQFVIGGCRWYLMAYPNGTKFNDCLSLYLVVAKARSLSSGWRRYAKFSLTIVNQHSAKFSQSREGKKWFDQKIPGSGFVSMLPLTRLHANTDGFLVNGEVKIVAEVIVLEVIGKLDEATSSSKKLKLNDDGEGSSGLHEENIDVNGFQVLPSQVELVRRIFERHPESAVEFRAKNQHLRTACMNVLLSLIETLCTSPQELSNEDLAEADNALAHVKSSGFKVDWLETKLDQVKKKKEKEQYGETRMQELKEELKDFKQKCLDLEALLEKEKLELLAARSPLSLDDVV